MKTLEYNGILDRLKAALNLASDTEMANLLGVGKATISNWRKRNTADLPLLFSYCEQIDLNWLIFGVPLTATDTSERDVTEGNNSLFNKVLEQAEEIGRLKERLAYYEMGKNSNLSVRSDSLATASPQTNALEPAPESV